MVTYHPHCGDHVPGLSAAVMFGAVFGVPDPFPFPPSPRSKPSSVPVRGNGDRPARHAHQSANECVWRGEALQRVTARLNERERFGKSRKSRPRARYSRNKRKTGGRGVSR